MTLYLSDVRKTKVVFSPLFLKKFVIKYMYHMNCIRCCPPFSSSVLLSTLENRRPSSVFTAGGGSSSCSSSGRKRSGDLRRRFTRGKLARSSIKRRAMMMMLPEEYALSSIPANEIAGFMIGFCMLYVVSQASKLDAIIASAQARSLARDDDFDDENNTKNGFGVMDEKDESVERVKRGKGNVFILPRSDSSSSSSSSQSSSKKRGE